MRLSLEAERQVHNGLNLFECHTRRFGLTAAKQSLAISFTWLDGTHINTPNSVVERAAELLTTLGEVSYPIVNGSCRTRIVDDMFVTDTVECTVV